MKLRGHLGSELQRKAAAILSIEKDGDPQISVVKALKVREGSPLDVPMIQFAWDKELGMHALEEYRNNYISQKNILILCKVCFLWHKHIVIRNGDNCIGCKKCIKTCPNEVFSSKKKN